MKRFFRFALRLLFIVAVAVAFILLGILVIRVDDLATQVADAVDTRAQSRAGDPRQCRGSQALHSTRTPTRRQNA